MSGLRPYLERHYLWLLLLLGAVLRLGYALPKLSTDVVMGEIANTAASLATRGSFADPFAGSTGLSAHVSPVYALIVAGVYDLFGVDSVAARLVLFMVALSTVLATFYLLDRIFRRLRASLAARIAALAILCLLPLNLFLETIWFQQWEVGLATLLSVAVLLLVLRFLDEPLTTRRFAGMACLAALLFVTNPSIALAAFGSLALLLLLRTSSLRRIGLASLGAAIIAAAALPWGLRNQQVLGQFIVTRSNFGLELALGNYPGAATKQTPGIAFGPRFHSIHPFRSPRVQAEVRASGGEIAYARKLGDEAKRWIAAHPAQFLRLTLIRLKEFWLPSAYHWAAGSVGTPFKMALFWLLTIGGFLELGRRALLRDLRYAFVAIHLIVPTLPYMITHVNLRYRYAITGLLVYLSAQSVLHLVGRARTSRALKPA